MQIDDLPTPSLVLDKRRVEVNTQAMRAHLIDHGVTLRTHAKTAKSADVARMAHGGNTGNGLGNGPGNGIGPLTISTLAEAAYFLDHGFTDLTYAVCITPGKLDTVAALMDRDADLKIITDSVDVADALVTPASGKPFKLLIEIDCGEHRTGVIPEGPELLEIANRAANAGAQIEGVLTHAGHSYLCRNAEEAANVAEQERQAAVIAAERLRNAGFECLTVSVGSTPTATHGRDFTGITEARPGVYVFQDMFQAAIGSCSVDDIALSVLASVTSCHPERGTLMLDAGGLALSKDRSTNGLSGGDDIGFGALASIDGDLLEGLVVASVHQEHGEVRCDDAKMLEALAVGTKVRILPNHACMTAAAYDTYHVVESGRQIVATWTRCNGW
jgi:D-serine deaminase-like pyridoxal phosphate-dependent protein